MLYIVSTPIGNLQDVTLRALEVLKKVEVIACEDTRRTQILLSCYQINTFLYSYHSHSPARKLEQLVSWLREEKDIALVSDAGTPGISDPGYKLISRAIEERLPLTVIPGPTALIAGLVLSGKPTARFVFEGFLSTKRGARHRRLLELKKWGHTVVFYESPYRIITLLEDILATWGDAEVCCIREITKVYEEVRRGKTSQLLTHFKNQKPRGEFIVVL